MTERPVGHDVATAVVAATLLAAGSVFPPAIGAVLAGVGIEVLGGLTEVAGTAFVIGSLSEQVLFDESSSWLCIAPTFAPSTSSSKFGGQLLLEVTPNEGLGKSKAVQGLFRMLREDAERIFRNELLREIAGDADYSGTRQRRFCSARIQPILRRIFTVTTIN